MTEPEAPERAAGRLVVATPTLADPNFSHAVVLVLEHAQDGALGVVLNRPSLLDAGAVLAGWGPCALDPPRLFIGGPVQAGKSLIALAQAGTLSPGAAAATVVPGVEAVDLGAEPPAEPEMTLRLFTGYAGWGAGQLDAEIAAGGWFLVDARADDVFTPDPGTLWRAVLAREGGLFSAVPDDPTWN